ncbi:hypothetical protein NIE88_04405 [Sporolactobacillus shoreicorticis]|uniref:DegT/DnrJ/EryC1/StrS aminotransferase family protein n=1 Tax=Sporolactobacillus shoreicorticis TaxID=1923877 RepID=A0ABW5RYT7_9BACL|nr:hypothetical protein [Sporolactobacillus shoreicorticis]MCO7125015.1 hypothetical protein [Sporolactobacillus shoreicorticis]
MTEQKKIIGGFFSLELPVRTEYHSQALRLNSARYALEYVLRIRNYKKIYLPAYICDSVLQPMKRLNVAFAFYTIDEHLAPIFNSIPEDDACLLYVNYFGINSSNVQNICHNLKHVIIDNTQAFFEQPLTGIDTVYSPRKFFGVPDGGYLYTDSKAQLDLEQNPSYYLCDALLKQIDLGSVSAEPLFEQNEAYLDTCGMHAMACATQRLLTSIDYEQARTIRNDNFHFLHQQLGRYNQLDTHFGNVNGPICYPFLIERGEQLKNHLLRHHIYADDFWEDALSRVPSASFEYRLAKDLVALPIDQRYTQTDMNYIVQTIRGFLI